ncbi:MAG: NAD(P)/FAD-dependent oxidoreductase [Candidatus Bathyarchaeia archaeon]
MENFSEVMVIGGGPSGSFCALNLAKKAVIVTVFEEHSEIGVPCHCAGHLSINGLKNLELYPLPKGIVENIFYGAKIYSPKGSSFSIRFSSPITCTVNRILFDKYLSQLAERAGASYLLGTRVESLARREENVEVIASKEDRKTIKFSGKVVVDAEGASCRILRQAGLNPPKNFVYCVNAEVENVKDVEHDEVEVFLGNIYAPGFYAWLIPKKEENAKIGLGTRTGNPKALLKKFINKHPVASRKLGKAKILHKNYHIIPLGGPVKKAYSDRFIAVGDAASHVKPTTGGGVILGLNCARIAADVVADAVRSGDLSAKSLEIYQKRLKNFLGFDMQVMLEIRKILGLMSDEDINCFIEFCKKSFRENDFQNLRDLDFQGRLLIKALQKPKSVMVMAYLAALIFRNAFRL